MRTTVDIPDVLYQQAKTKAISSGVTFRHYLLSTLQKDLEQSQKSAGKRLKGPLFSKNKPLISTRKQLEEILEEDRALFT